MKLKILAIAALLATVCFTSFVQAETRRSIQVFKNNQAQIQQLLETKKCPGCQLIGADLSHAALKDANLSKAKLIGVNLQGAQLENANLAEAELGNANLKGANLKGVDAEKARLVSADLTNSNLADANLFRANLTNTNLRKADLKEANLSLADLSNADLSQADLSQANLEHAYMVGTKLDGANLNQAILPPSKAVRDTLLPLLYLAGLALLWGLLLLVADRNLSSWRWQIVLFLGSTLAGWILAVMNAPEIGWILIVSGVGLGMLVGLLDGWYVRSVKRKKLEFLDRMNEVREASVGLRGALGAGLLAALIAWVLVLPGIIPFAQWGVATSWSWSWSAGMASHTAGPAGWSNQSPSIGTFLSTSVLYAFLWPLFWLGSRSQDPCQGGADVVGSGTYYFADLGTIAPAAIAIAVALAVTTTVAQTKLQAFGIGIKGVRTFWIGVVVTGIGLILGWIIDSLLLPGYGTSLNLFIRECT